MNIILNEKKFKKYYYLKPIKEMAILFNVSVPTIVRTVRRLKLKLPESIKQYRREQTNLKKYGCKNPSQYKKFQKKREKTFLKKYGCKSSLSSKKVRNKIKKTCLERYGVDSTLKAKEIREKIKQTCLKKYGTIQPMKNKKVQDKFKRVLKEKFGTEYILQNKKIKEKAIKTQKKKYKGLGFGSKVIMNKIQDTMLKKYGVTHVYLLYDNIKRTSNTKPNIAFAKLLKKYKIKYGREYPLLNRSYDFILPDYRMLIEINPSITHNSSFGIRGRKPLDKNYHFNKTKLANDNGFKCICIWDWDDPEKIVKAIKENRLKIIKDEKIKPIYWNMNKKIKTTKKDIKAVKIYTDKQKIYI